MKTGTIDNPAATEITAEYYADRSGDGRPGLVVTINLPRDLIDGTDYILDSIIETDPAEGTITVRCYPNAAAEGYDLLGDVGEWP